MLVAMSLDTLPEVGRTLLLACLLVTALFGFSTMSSVRRDVSTSIVLRKGAFVAVLLVPVAVYLTRLRMPVYVDQMVQFQQTWPALVSFALVIGWFVVAAYLSIRLLLGWRADISQLPDEVAPEKIDKRAEHWRRRLGLQARCTIVVAGGLLPRHMARGFGSGYTVVLPAAARNWPTGVLDVCLLTQLAQIKQRAWFWMMFSRWVGVLFWPLPWVKRLVTEFCDVLIEPSQRLAAAAYRDPVGWQRDFRQALQRTDTLQHALPGVLHLPAFCAESETAAEPVSVEDLSYEGRRKISKARVRDKYHDPHERAYWLIASACVVVAVASTLTVVQAPPEFEPKFLHIKWQDQVARRLVDESAPAPRQPAPPAQGE